MKEGREGVPGSHCRIRVVVGGGGEGRGVAGIRGLSFGGEKEAKLIG